MEVLTVYLHAVQTVVKEQGKSDESIIRTKARFRSGLHPESQSNGERCKGCEDDGGMKHLMPLSVNRGNLIDHLQSGKLIAQNTKVNVRKRSEQQ
jgi:hypothetical protein